MKIAIQVPIKGKSSERIPNKNFARLRDKPLCHWLLQELSEIKDDTIAVFIDISEDREVYEKVEKNFPNLDFHQRPRWFAEDHANETYNPSIALAHPQFDAYAQIFVTWWG